MSVTATNAPIANSRPIITAAMSGCGPTTASVPGPIAPRETLEATPTTTDTSTIATPSVGNARTPHTFALGIIPMGRQSSAYGYSQALNGTWEEYQNTAGGRGAKRDDIGDATDFMGWYMDQSSNSLGISKDDAEGQYLAYHEGRTGYANQSHLGKPWLVDVAAAVGARSEMYRVQLQSCR